MEEMGAKNVVKFMRTKLTVGLPLVTLIQRFVNSIDEYEKQREVINDFYEKAQNYLNYIMRQQAGKSYLYSSLYSEAWQVRQQELAVEYDTRLVYAGFFLMVVTISVYSLSPAVALVGLMFVILSIYCSAFITINVFQISYRSIISQMNFAVILIVCSDMICLTVKIRRQTKTIL